MNVSSTSTFSPPPPPSSSSAAAAAAYHRSQLSIPSLTRNHSSNKTRYASLSPPSAASSHRHHPYKMSHSMSHPGTSSASMRMATMAQSPPTSPPGKDHTSNYYSPPTSPSYHAHSHPNDSLEERRQRNKEASAKYRQRKNTQQHEMRNTICQLSDRNAMLERQLQEVKQENQQLRATADKLRGKLVASRLLDQWMQKHPNTQPVDMSQVDIDSDDDDALLMHDL